MRLTRFFSTLLLGAAVFAAGLAQAAEPPSAPAAAPEALAPVWEAPAAELVPSGTGLAPDWTLEPGLGDGRRTMGRFGANLGRSFIGVVSRDNLKPFLIGVGVAGAGSFLDRRTETFFTQHPNRTLANTGQKLGQANVLAPLTAGLFLAGRATSNTRFRAATYDIAQAFVVNAAWTTALKFGTHRARPDGSNRFSFPSGHTSNAFAWATVANHHYGPRAGIPAYLAAGLIGASRLEKNVHHLSDVLAGAALGYVVGRTVVREDGEPIRRRTHISLAPATAPSGTGVGMALSVEF